MNIHKRYRAIGLSLFFIAGVVSLCWLEVLSNQHSTTVSEDTIQPVETYDVVLDAGHGGSDTGVVSGTLQEKDITLSIVLEIGRLLEQDGYRVAYTRTGNEEASETIDIEKRIEIIEDSKALLLLSIHLDESYDKNNYGYEVVGKIKQKEVFQYARYVMSSMQMSNLSQSHGMKDQDVAPQKILEESPIPSLMITCGYIMNKHDQDIFRDDEKLHIYANYIKKGIVTTLKEIKEK